MVYRCDYAKNPDTKESANMTRAQAVKHIKASTGRAYIIHCRVNAPVAADPENKVFPLSACVTVTRAQAVKYVEEVLAGRFEAEALMPVRTYRGTMFIG